MMDLSTAEREILERMAKPGHYEPYAPTMNDYPTPEHVGLATRGLIQWAKAPHSLVEWEITDAGRLELGQSFDEYRGMSYAQASHEAERLIKRRGWYQSFERLAALREIMQRAAGRVAA